jgi:hypothetical protein
VFNHPLEPLRTTVLPCTSQPPLNIKFSIYKFITVIQYLSMAYRSYHYSATLLCSTCISVFLHTPHTLYVFLPFILCVPCPFNAPFLFCAFWLLHSASFNTHKSLSTTTPISSLFCIFILFVHLIHPPCIVPLHALQRAIVLFIELFTPTSIFSLLRSIKRQHTLFVLHVLLVSSPLPHHYGNSSSFLAVIPMHSSSLGVMLRFLSLSSSRDSLSYLSQSRSSSLLQLQASMLFHLSITSMNSLHSTGRFLETLQILWRSP